MLIRHDILEKIHSGDVTLQFRRWRRPTVKPDGTLLTKIGQLAIEAVDAVDAAGITHADARRAGYPDADVLRAELATREGDVYRVRLSLRGEDPRAALRARVPVGDELAELTAKVTAFDQRSKSGPWAVDALRAIAARPAVRAGDLADAAGMIRKDFKARVRKLKALGLTESLAVGYRLSPRGAAVLAALDA
ncbi:MAG: hypothetical protein VYD05_08495 [Planctomycetota bacterium]|nr:hypothetical protein [Planctomycetota bacterium]